MTLALKTLLNDSVELRALIGKAQNLCTLQQLFTAVAPSNLIPYCQVTSLEQGTLTIVTGNAIIAAKLRQLAPQVVVDMQKGGSQVSGIRVKVQVSYPQPERPKAPRRLSPKVQDTLISFGEALEDSPLKDAIRKLSNKR
ncbi:MAG: DciA family protein [Gallionella sp.]|nr:DciA family protein [Gallionella sp.]